MTSFIIKSSQSRNLSVFLVLLLFCSLGSMAQPCTQLGQNPTTAFPVCGTSNFVQQSVNICGDRRVASPCNGGGITVTDKNPYYYKFTCFRSGTLGFTIRPNTPQTSDYDWQLFDVTGQNPNVVFTDINTVVSANWSGEFGITGASNAGSRIIECAGSGVPLFSAMPNISQGRQYILMVSHFTNTQSGYTLSFGGGSASITDPLEPAMLSAEATCDGTTIRLKLNKRISCNSISAIGSEFSILPATANITQARGIGCLNGFETDSLVLTLNSGLPPGNYQLRIGNGTDGNTLLDFCDRPIPVGSQVPLNVTPVTPTPMDSIIAPSCSPTELELVFRKNMRCNSIAPNGSDFRIDGPYPINVIGAAGVNCTDGLSKRIKIQLRSPMQRAGNFRVILQAGSDGNTLIDECAESTPAGSAVAFQVFDTVSARFNFTLNLGCEEDTVYLTHDGANGVNQWNWTFEANGSSTLQNPVIRYQDFRPKQVDLIVSNGICKDTFKTILPINHYIEARFETDSFICPGDRVLFKDLSIGNVRQWNWKFGNGNTSLNQLPVLQTFQTGLTNYTAEAVLIITNELGCKDTAKQTLTIVNNCLIDLPNAFTPNRDGLNDFFYPLNAYQAKNLAFSVYNRFGKRVFTTSNWNVRWDGTINGKAADPGTYVWFLRYEDRKLQRTVERKGTVLLIR
jgi:gliding motility-associated-like protein